MRGRRDRARVTAVVWATALLCAGQTFAAAPGAGATFETNPVNYVPPPTERRGGFAMAVDFGYGIGSYRGYPLDVAALNDPSKKRSTGPAFASQTSLWFGGALRDWLTTGIGLSLRSASGDVIGASPSIIFRVETFPLFSLGGTFRHLGLGFDGGLATAAIVSKDKKERDEPLAEGGALSSVGLVLFWEPLQFWHFSAGPQLTYVHGFSQTMHVDQATLGFRLALYGVQPKKPKTGGGT